MRLDFSEVAENKNAALGEQEMSIIAAVEKRSQNGTQMLVLDMKDPEGGFCRDHVCLEGAGAFKAKQLFEALGIDEEQAASMDASDLVGMVVQAEIVNEPYEGVDRSKVKKYIK